MKILIIVESPSKCKKIADFLNNNIKNHHFTCIASVGHIVNLKKKKAIDVENDFKPEFVVCEDENNLKTVANIRKLAKINDKIVLATDNDREGERISYDINNILDMNLKEKNRMIFNEITETAIIKSFKKLKKLDMNLVDSQITRRVIDRLIGFSISPITMKHVQSQASAGRVVSITTKIIFDREKEINQHKINSSFKTLGSFIKGKILIEDAELNEIFENEKKALKFITSIKNSTFFIGSKKFGKNTRKPSPPFITSTINQASPYSVKKTTAVLQQLYQGGKITYIRTDSTSMSKTAQKDILSYVEKTYGDKYMEKRDYGKKVKGAQEAHECIRPTKMTYLADRINNHEQQVLYDIIWKRTIASQMSDNIMESMLLRVHIKKKTQYFKKKYLKLIFDGWKKVYDSDDSDKNYQTIMNTFEIDNVVKSKIIESKENFSKHVGRYTEASLVKKLENMGIGRPSTYSSAVSNIQNKGYVTKGNIEGMKIKAVKLVLSNHKISKKMIDEVLNSEHNKLILSELGEKITKYMIKHFPTIMNYEYTLNVEEDLDYVAKGDKVYKNVVGKYYNEFIPEVEKITLRDRKKRKSIKKGGNKDTNYDEIGTYKTIKFYRFNSQWGPRVTYGKPGDDDTIYLQLEKGILMDNITIKDAIAMLPLEKGKFERKPVSLHFGTNLYIKHGKDNIPLNWELREKTKAEMTLKELIERIKEYREYKKNIKKDKNKKKNYKKRKQSRKIKYSKRKNSKKKK